MLKWNGWSFYWIVVWFGVLFLGPELYAIFTNPKNTLSYQVWHLEGMGLKGLAQNPLNWSFGHYVVFAGMVWLIGHFVFDLWR
jgi:hypothetical protein